MPTGNTIVCEHVNYVYSNGTVANRDICLSIAAGESFCILGENGAGKSTLVRQITTELRPTSGRILIEGHDAHTQPSLTKRKLGVIPQAAGLFTGLTVEEHLRYFCPLKRLKAEDGKEAVDRVIESCGLVPARKTRVGKLSGGQQRAVLIALALLSNPEILILDEPTVGLDPILRRSFWALIEEQRALGKTVLLTTHYMEEAEKLATRVAFMNKGTLRWVGAISDLATEMGNSFRLMLFDAGGEHVRTYFFNTLSEAQDCAQSQSSQSYSIGRVSLEDLYVRLMAE